MSQIGFRKQWEKIILTTNNPKMNTKQIIHELQSRPKNTKTFYKVFILGDGLIDVACFRKCKAIFIHF